MCVMGMRAGGRGWRALDLESASEILIHYKDYNKKEIQLAKRRITLRESTYSMS